MIPKSRLQKLLDSDRFFIAFLLGIVLLYLIIVATQPPAKYTPCDYRWPTTGQQLDCIATRTAQPRSGK